MLEVEFSPLLGDCQYLAGNTQMFSDEFTENVFNHKE